MEVSGMNATSTDNRSSAIVVSAGITISLSLLFTSFRTLIAVKKKIQVRWDDWFIFAALVTSLAQSITWTCASQHGLGRHLKFVSKTDLRHYFELTYSSQVLGILAMTFSKISVSLLMRRLSIDKAPIMWSGPVTSMFAWACFAIPAILFQCKPSNPWDSSPSNCPHRDDIWFSIGSFNVVTDTFLALYVASKIWNLKMDGRVRTTVIILFMSRLLVVVMTMVQVSLAPRSFRDEDFTYGSVNFAIITNVVVHLSLITAILPRIRLLAIPNAIRTLAQPAQPSLHPLSPFSPKSPTYPPQTLDLTRFTTASDFSHDLHSRPNSQLSLAKSQSGFIVRSITDDDVTKSIDTTYLKTNASTHSSLTLVPRSTIAELKTNAYRPFTIAESFHSDRRDDNDEIEYARGGFTNVSFIKEPPKVLEIGLKTEVHIEINDVGSSRTTSVLMEQKKVSPRDILKLEQKMNKRRDDEKVFETGWGAGVSFEC